MQDEAKKGQQEMRQSLLDEMRQIKKDHTSRTAEIEESVVGFEHMVKELYESNKAKSVEMATYEKRLVQIGSATACNASKVDDLATSMNNKVDKLNLIMEAFINVMADAMWNGNNSTDCKEQ